MRALEESALQLRSQELREVAQFVLRSEGLKLLEEHSTAEPQAHFWLGMTRQVLETMQQSTTVVPHRLPSG